MNIPGIIFDKKATAGTALPSGAGDPGDEQADLIAGFVALGGVVATVFDEPFEGLEKRVPLLVGDQMSLVGKIIRPVVHDFAAVALDLHDYDAGGVLRPSAAMLWEKTPVRQEWDGANGSVIGSSSGDGVRLLSRFR